MLTYKEYQVQLLECTYMEKDFSLQIYSDATDSNGPDNVLKKLKHGSIIVGC